MKVLIVSPLFPPEVGGSAPYAKELAERLSKRHTVSVIAFCHFPETVPNVTITSVSKNIPLARRLFLFTRTLITHARATDVVIIENGTSTELAGICASFFFRKTIIFHISDTKAHERSATRVLTSMIEKSMRARATHVLLTSPLPRPEILPLEPEPREAVQAYTDSWNSYLATLESLFV